MNTPYIVVIVLDAQDTKMTLSPPPMSLQTGGEKLANSKNAGNCCNKLSVQEGRRSNSLNRERGLIEKIL